MKRSIRTTALSLFALALGLALVARPVLAVECEASCDAPVAKAAGPGGPDQIAQAAGGEPAAKGLQEPVPAVLADYTKIHEALSADTLNGVSAAAGNIARLVKADAGKTLPAEVATHAEALAKAVDLEAARASFKPLSKSLIDYLGQAQAQGGEYKEMYCGMAKASWLQTGKDIKNPYYGASMAGCGEVKRTF